MDLNADLGEGFGVWRLGDDEAMLDVITSANVACGFHAGDAATMRRVCVAAAARGVAVGAQVSYRDLAGFGRRRIDYDPGELRDDVLYQIAALDGIARVAGTRVSYVKPHGALYNTAADDEVQANAVVRRCRGVRHGAGRARPARVGLAARGRRRRPPLRHRRLRRSRLPRAPGGWCRDTRPDALVVDPAAVAARALAMAGGEIVAVDGTVVRQRVESICVHGDTPGAVALATSVRRTLSDAGIAVSPFGG